MRWYSQLRWKLFVSHLVIVVIADVVLLATAFFLARLGLVTYQSMLRYFRYAVLVIVIVAAVLTPGPDVASQMLMAGPLLVLYIISIGVAYVFGRTPAPAEAADDATE